MVMKHYWNIVDEDHTTNPDSHSAQTYLKYGARGSQRDLLCACYFNQVPKALAFCQFFFEDHVKVFPQNRTRQNKLSKVNSPAMKLTWFS